MAGLAFVALGSAASGQSVQTTGDVNPSPAVSPTWNVGADLFVGENASGTLTIQGGGAVTSTNSRIAYQTGTIGAVTVTGSGSNWTTGVDLSVGDEGHGTLIVEDGATVVNLRNAWIGRMAGSTGMVTVTGDGSTWTSTSFMDVGRRGDGVLNVLDGATVNTSSSVIGRLASGTVIVSGQRSSFIHTGALFLGMGTTTGGIGDGTLFVENGGEVASVDTRFGQNPGSTGMATVTGTGSIWSTSNLFTVGNQGTGTLTIGDGGTVRVGGGAGTATLALGNGSTGILNIGGGAGGPATAPGVLEAGSVNFGNGTGTINFNHTGTNYVFAPSISGNGTINVHSGTTKLAAISDGFSGTSAVTGGTLAVDGTLGGTINVLGTGTLAGSGTVGTTVIASGGTIAPGNSIGAMTVAGDLTFEAGSIFEVEVDPTGTASDLVVVTGTATLNGGSVVHVGQDGNYQPLSDYTILTATGGIVGAFDGVTSNYVFLDPLLVHQPNQVILRLERNQVAFSTFGETPNQKQTAQGLDSLDFSNPAYQALTLLSSQQDIRPALDRLSGEIHASGKSGRIMRSARLRSIISQRIRSAFSGGQDQGSISSHVSSYVPVASGTPFDGMAASSGGPRYTAWVQGFGHRGHIGGDGNAAGLSHDDVGILVGGEVTSGYGWHAGVFGGYSRSQERAADRFSSGHSDDYHFGIHGGADIGMMRLSAGAAHSWHSIASTRNVAFGGFIDTLTASYNARTAQFFGEASLPVTLGGLDVEPFAALAHVHLWTDGFGESGGAAALTAQASSMSTTFSTLGLRASHEFALGDIQARARAMIGWQHAFGTTTPSQNFSFAGGSMFSIAGTPIDRHAALLEVGLDLATSARSSLGLSYEGRFARRGHEHGVNARLNVSF